MRLFKDFKQAQNEIRRDLSEMGTRHETKTMQDKIVEGEQGMATVELINYGYTVLEPSIQDIEGRHVNWCVKEWEERAQGIRGANINPGTAWMERPEVWTPFLHNNEFSYTYPQRLASCAQVENVIKRLKEDKGSRQLFISIWDTTDSMSLGKERVPCTLGYMIQYRDGKLNITSLMRSCDLFTHYPNDCVLTLKLLDYICFETKLQMGTFSHFINSFHVYEKDIKNVF